MEFKKQFGEDSDSSESEEQYEKNDKASVKKSGRVRLLEEAVIGLSNKGKPQWEDVNMAASLKKFGLDTFLPHEVRTCLAIFASILTAHS